MDSSSTIRDNKLKTKNGSPFLRLWEIIPVIVLFFCVLSGHAYEYEVPMEDTLILPLTIPKKPFVLRFSREELLAQPVWSTKIDGIIISNQAQPPVKIAAETLREEIIKSQFGDAYIIEVPPAYATIPKNLKGKHFILLGRPEDFMLLSSLAAQKELEVTDKALNGDGFIIKPIKQDTNDLLLITSCVSRGVLYGAYELEERITHRGVPEIDETSVPAVRYRSWSFYNFFDVPKGLAGRMRYNLSIHYLGNRPSLLAYRDFPELGADKNIALRREIQSKLHNDFADAMKFGVTPVCIFNPLAMNSTPAAHGSSRYVLSKAYPKMMAKPWGPFGTDLSHPKANIHTLHRYNLCPSNPNTRRFVECGVRELIRTFPEIGMLGLQFSDEGGELICGCDQCSKKNYLDRIVEHSKFVMEVARSENPDIKFMVFIHGVNWWIPLHQPEYENDQAGAIAEIYKRLDNDLEALMMLRSTPTGGDLQSWLYPVSTMLGKDIPLLYFFHSYEAGGPGIVAPVSNLMSHLSWPLPVLLKHLEKFLQPDQGMIGGASPIAGMEVAWWYPDMNANKYMSNWCRAKYGKDAGEYVSKALVDTHKITEAFLLETKQDCSESFTMYRWKNENYLKPWKGDIDSLKNLERLTPKDVDAFKGLGLYGFMVPQAKQPLELETVSLTQKEFWQNKFEITEEIAIAERAEAMLKKAYTAKPDAPDIQRLYELAKATNELTHLFKEYHTALLYANLSRNTNDSEKKEQFITQSHDRLKNAIRFVVNYSNILLNITRNDQQIQYRLWIDVRRLYVGCPMSIVREAAYLFDQEFGGESMTNYFDKTISAEPNM